MAEMEYVRASEEQERKRAGAPSRALPWASLPQDEKETCRSVVRRIPALLAQAGFQVCRLPASSGR